MFILKQIQVRRRITIDSHENVEWTQTQWWLWHNEVPVAQVLKIEEFLAGWFETGTAIMVEPL